VAVASDLISFDFYEADVAAFEIANKVCVRMCFLFEREMFVV
jgi:hypothetical protein